MSETLRQRARRTVRLDTPAQLLVAKVRSDAQSATDPVFVTVPSQSGRTRRGPCDWMPRGTGEWPSAGDPARVQEDEAGQLLIVWWKPA